MNINQAQIIYDNELPNEEHICIRCEDEETEEGEEYCEYCIDIIKHQNRSRFISEETY